MKTLVNKWLGAGLSGWSNFKLQISDYFRQRNTRWYAIALFALNLAIWGIAAFIFWRIKAQIAVTGKESLVITHYNILFGIDRVADVLTVFILPAFGFGCIVVNIILSLWLVKKDLLVHYLLLGGAAVVNLFLLMATYSIYMINLGK